MGLFCLYRTSLLKLPTFTFSASLQAFEEEEEEEKEEEEEEEEE